MDHVLTAILRPVVVQQPIPDVVAQVLAAAAWVGAGCGHTVWPDATRRVWAVVVGVDLCAPVTDVEVRERVEAAGFDTS